MRRHSVRYFTLCCHYCQHIHAATRHTLLFLRYYARAAISAMITRYTLMMLMAPCRCAALLPILHELRARSVTCARHIDDNGAR